MFQVDILFQSIFQPNTFMFPFINLCPLVMNTFPPAFESANNFFPS